MPTLSLAAADNLTQRTPNPFLLRASATSSQAMHPMGHYAATELKLKRLVTISEDFAFGYEQMGGFQAAFQKDGGCVVTSNWLAAAGLTVMGAWVPVVAALAVVVPAGAVALWQEAGSVTRKNFLRIEEGMTPTEVAAILGAPASETDLMETGGANQVSKGRSVRGKDETSGARFREKFIS